jgi:phage tail-like protein
MRSEPLPTYHFYVDIESVFKGNFQKVTGLSVTHDVIESWAAGKDGDTEWIKQPGRPKYEDVQLTCAFNKDVAPLCKWFQDVNDGKVLSNRQNATIWTFTQDNVKSVGWRLMNVYPKAIKYPDMDTSVNQPATMVFTLTIENLVLLP